MKKGRCTLRMVRHYGVAAITAYEVIGVVYYPNQVRTDSDPVVGRTVSADVTFMYQQEWDLEIQGIR